MYKICAHVYIVVIVLASCFLSALARFCDLGFQTVSLCANIRIFIHE